MFRESIVIGLAFSWVGSACDRNRTEPPPAEPPAEVLAPGSSEPGKPANQLDEERCAGPHLGEWRGVTHKDQVTYAADCTYTYRGADDCAEKGTYARALEAPGEVLVTVVESTGGDCYPIGPHSCRYELSADKLTVDCGEGAYVYERP